MLKLSGFSWLIVVAQKLQANTNTLNFSKKERHSLKYTNFVSMKSCKCNGTSVYLGFPPTNEVTVGMIHTHKNANSLAAARQSRAPGRARMPVH